MNKNKKWLIGTIMLLFAGALVYFVFINNRNNNVEAKTNITLKGNEYLTIEIGNDYEEKGAEALDNDGNDISNKIEITGIVDITKPGIYKITYTIIDSDNNKITKIREVKVIDTIKPTVVFETNGSNTAKQTHQTKVTVEDIGGVDASSLKYLWSDSQDKPEEEDFFLKFDNNTIISNTETKGIYYLWIIAKDESGNTSIVMSNGFNFNYTPQSSKPTPSPVVSIPEVKLLGSSPVTIEVGSSYVDAGAIADDEKDGILVPIATTNLNANEVGTYYVTYTVTNSAGKQASKTRIINVVDTTKPVITLTGNSTVTIEVGSDYNDEGATALDNYDGNLTTQIVIDGTVDTEEIGTYIITYNVIDSSGNEADEVTRTVYVVDSTAPEVLFDPNGNSDYAKTENITVTVTDEYAGVDEDSLKYLWNTSSLEEPEEEDFSATFINTSSISTPDGVTGTYYLWILAKDNSDNTIIIASEVFHLDNTAPEITLLGSSPVTIEVGSDYDDEGATALDNIDGVLTTQIVIVGTVDTEEIGTYIITYNVIDSSGNKADEVTRTVHVVDTTIPVITLTGASTVTIEVGSDYNDEGATALDNYDGNLTTQIVTDGTVDEDELGTYIITYNVEDSSGNKADEVTRTVHVTDTTKPVITLTGASTVTIEVGSDYEDEGATALDNYDGNLTTQIVIVGTVDTEEIGTYIITYNVIDSSGNKADEVTRTVHVVDTTIPVITLTGASTVTIEVGSDYNDEGATALDNYDGNLTTQIVTDGTVDEDELGTYIITYNVEDSSGNKADEVTRTVHVTDTTKPVITLTGASTVTIEVGSDYEDEGATALDNYDGVLTTQIVIVGTVDTEEIGTYIITYNVIDSSGNKADEVTRTVHVTDTTKPVITLTGASTVTIEVGSDYEDEGATALDNYDGVLTTQIVIVGTVDTEELGTYIITYNVIDSSGNKADEVTRTVHVTDTTKPVITLTGASTVTIEVGSDYEDEGATALDNYDGNLTTQIVTDGTVDEDELGTYIITYNVTDSSGNEADEVTRTVYVVDSTAPEVLFAPNGNSDYAKTENITVTVTDEYAGVDEASLKYLWNTSSLEKPEEEDFSDTDTFVNTSSISTPDGVTGTYYLWILAKDNSDNTIIIASEVFHLDNTAPEITLLGSSPVTIEVGSDYEDEGATALDNIDGVITENIVVIYELVINEEEEYGVVEEIDTSSVATYRIRYNVEDSSGNKADEVTRIVHVVEE